MTTKKVVKKAVKVVPFELPYLSAKELDFLLTEKMACWHGAKPFRGKSLLQAFKVCKKPSPMRWILNQMVGYTYYSVLERPSTAKAWGGVARFKQAKAAANEACLKYDKKHPTEARGYNQKEADKVEADAFKKFYTIAPRREA